LISYPYAQKNNRQRCPFQAQVGTRKKIFSIALKFQTKNKTANVGKNNTLSLRAENMHTINVPFLGQKQQ